MPAADEAQVDRFAALGGRGPHRPRVDEAAVLAVESDRLRAVPVDEAHELLVELDRKSTRLNSSHRT